MNNTYIIDDVEVKKRMLDSWGSTQQKQLAETSGISEGTLVRVLAGRGWSPDTLYRLCQVLECSPNDILKKGRKR